MNKGNKIKVAHIITKLELGGAQKNTLYTITHLNRAAFKASLISGTGGILDNTVCSTSAPAVFIKDLIQYIIQSNRRL